MQIVINIPEDVYTRLFDNGIQDNEIATDDICEMARSLRLGTPLPKGHGTLKDTDKLRLSLEEHHDFFIDSWGGFSNMPVKEKARVDEITNCIAEIVNAPTIIEADTEGENDC